MDDNTRSSPLSQPGFDDYNTQLQAAALKATRLSAALPSDLAFYRSVDKALARDVDSCKSKVLSLTNKLLQLASSGTGSDGRARKRPRLENEDDVVDDFHGTIVDLMDQMLERTDMRLDDLLGVSKVSATVVQSKQEVKVKKNRVPQGRLDPALQHASRLPKPQLSFTRRVDNKNSASWQSTLRHKYNAQVPLGYNWQSEHGDPSLANLLHPYHYEIRHIDYPQRMFQSIEPISPKSFEDTPFVWVDTPAVFSTMLDSLRGAQELAIDLEYHSYRTFAGFVCLMQISTRGGDWIVDTLALREELEDLNEVFTDPNVVKVFHGAESDIVWLQQDFNLYIVNLFDTYHASKVLEFPRHGLATLLEMYCDFTPDKRFQLADWRIRPLPQEMLDYARSDTHYLLFIYDNLRNALLDRSLSRSQSRIQSPAGQDVMQDDGASPRPPDFLLREVLSRSEETALRIYEKEVYDAETGSGPGGWDTLAKKWNKGPMLSGQDGTPRMEIYKRMHAWRDRVAREEDESTRYVLPNHYLFLLAERPPNDLASLLAMFSSVPLVIRRRAKELMDEIRASTQVLVDTLMDVATEPVPTLATTPSAADAVTDTTVLFQSTSVATSTSRVSSLFGDSLVTSQVSSTVSGYATDRSALFARSSHSGKSRQLSSSSRFQDILVRIHKDLVIAPTAPVAAIDAASSRPATHASTDIKVTVVEEQENISGQAEVAFVPTALRKKEPSAAPDEIITVGQAQRKRKRKQVTRKVVAVSSDASRATSQDVNVEESEDTINILDAGSDHEHDIDVRKKKFKPPTNFHGGFRAPPKSQSSLRSGNQSRTFR
ncbi:unnamed protein product [Somion occarium]|uniref:HRDC domain-containing protein n=1 Tax=Somion occarium TaxID=3059160 RepID=A0ABP1E1Y7_9APHY